jgi:hypothetical protein
VGGITNATVTRRQRQPVDSCGDLRMRRRSLLDLPYKTSLAVRCGSLPSIPEDWSRDVTVDIADELRRRFPEYDEVPRSVQEFLETAVRR